VADLRGVHHGGSGSGSTFGTAMPGSVLDANGVRM
jgi:hypothetical protein